MLVSLHELGHLLVARWCGIKVLRFSVGVGKPLWTKHWRNIDWCLAPIPLGGYVKMVDTREGNVADADLPYAFDKQHPLKRIAVVIAGPLTNLFLAIILYGLSYGLGGVTEIKPYVGTVIPHSIADQAGFQAGDKILSVNGQSVHDFQEAQVQIVLALEAGKVQVLTQQADGLTAERVIDIAGTEKAEAVAKRQADLGFSPFRYTDEIGSIAVNKPAAKAGLQAGDRIVAIDGQATPTWADWSKIVSESAGRNLQVTYIRHGEEKQTIVLPESRESADKNRITGFIGVGPALDKEWAEKVRHHYQPSWQQAIALGWGKMVSYAELTLSFFANLITGNASLSHISGPITIADVAGQTMKIGWQPYIEFLALVSISLGIMNLLPIPMLDGGHLVYYVAELVRGKPLSVTVQEWGLRLGLTVMLAMMILAFFNDITRLFG